MRNVSEKLKFSLVLPAYLEEENLRFLLPRLKSTLDSYGSAYEIVVVDTSKKLDMTEEACTDFGVRYVNRSPGDTFGDAVRTGIREAQGQWILFMDADGSHSPEFVPRLLKETEDYPIVIASRYTEGGMTENTAVLRWMSWILNVTYAIVLGLKVKDVSNSFKIYRADLLKSLTLKCQNFDIVEEILYKIVRKNQGIQIKEIPFAFKKRIFGETKRNLFTFILTYIFTMIRLRFSK